MNRLRLTWCATVIALGLSGCTTFQAEHAGATEQDLLDAGFEQKPADTPAKLAKLQALPPRKLIVRTRDGMPQYVYADPTVCGCVYVGTEEQYQRFTRLRRNDEFAGGQELAAEQFASPFYADYAYWW
jgi:hypothetical protein